ncbi:CASP-like protein 1U4 [Dichanthelium oligosanthes]|uniref:CASP-like protein n=1 Tax=Dichanthelium oligosanthes TaxID=888268 RepID=A0A1E5UYV3_9POAL|nr:CASP-like protein 1U4 [Dichanthelium oligosanthes]
MCGEKKSGGGSGKWHHPVSLVFRIAGMGLAVASAAVMATASQCTVYADYGARPRTVTYTDFPAFVYLVVAASIAAALEAVAIFLSVCKGKGKKARAVLMPLLAAVVPALLYTSAGAAFGAGWDIYYYMEPSGRRLSVCASSVGGRFCAQVHVSMWLSLGAAVAVSLAEWAAMSRCCHGGGGGGGSCSDSDSDSESVCGHGCHSKH